MFYAGCKPPFTVISTVHKSWLPVPEFVSPAFTITQRRRNNRSIQTNRKGFRPSIRRKRYAFQPGDIVVYDHERFSVVGMHNYGKSIVIKGGGKKMDINTKKVKLARYGKGLQFAPQFLPTLSDGVSLGGVG